MRMLCANGAKNKHSANNTATVTAVSPVLPPSLIPAPLSMYEVVLLVPANAPTDVATGQPTMLYRYLRLRLSCLLFLLS